MGWREQKWRESEHKLRDTQLLSPNCYLYMYMSILWQQRTAVHENAQNEDTSVGSWSLQGIHIKAPILLHDPV